MEYSTKTRLPLHSTSIFYPSSSLHITLNWYNLHFYYCWGPSASEGPQKHNLTMFSKYVSRYLRNQVVDIQKHGQDEA
jgi:hypothetical protein